MPITLPDLIIFDCDGVLVDSEPLESRILLEIVGELGMHMTLEQSIALHKGRKLADCFDAVSRHFGRPLPDDITATYRARTTAAFLTELQPIPGIRDALARINVPVAAASNGPREKIVANLRTTGLLEFFGDRIFSAYEIDRWKPDPALYLHAAAGCGVAPACCAVVEDSLPGIQAGLAARMSTFAFTSEAEWPSLRALGAIPFARMSELPPLLGMPLTTGRLPV